MTTFLTVIMFLMFLAVVVAFGIYIYDVFF